MEIALDYIIRTPQATEFEQIRQLRHDVLDPARRQDTELDISSKDLDTTTIHAAAFLGGKVVSTVRFDRVDDETYLVRKMATDEPFQQRGFGGLVLKFAEEQAISKGAQTIVLNAREGAIRFYEQHGYALTGDQVVHDDGIPNFTMTRQVQDDK